MPYKIVVEEHHGQPMVNACLEGDIGEEERNRFVLDTLKVMRKHNIRKTICDIREVKLAYSLISSHNVILSLGNMGLEINDFVAVIYRNDKDQHEHSARVAMNRGMVNLHYFTDMEEAIQWLASKK